MEYRFAERMEKLTGSAIREIFKLLGQPGIISFAGGMPSQKSFPVEEIAQISQELIESNGVAILQYGNTEGWDPLRESVRQIIQGRGIEAKMENILTLTGSSQGIELFTKLMINPGDTILCEAPSFLGALQTFASYQANVVGVQMDEDGMILEDLEEKIKLHTPKFLYTIPTFQNPMGVSLSNARRQRVAELTARYGVMVLEDDPYCDLRYEGEAQPSIKSFDDADNVIHLLSFSKTISPGLRVGAAIGNPQVIRKMAIAKQGMDTHTSNLSQAIVDAYIRSGRYQEHIREILPDYRDQRDAMLGRIREFPSGVTYTQPKGGLFIWAELPEAVNATELLKQAVEHNVAYIPGEHFYAQPGHSNTMRLNFSACPCETIQRGMDILKGVIEGAIR